MTPSRILILTVAVGAVLTACTSTPSNDLNLGTTSPTTDPGETTTTTTTTTAVVTVTTDVADQSTTTTEASTTVTTENPTTTAEVPATTTVVEAQVAADFELMLNVRLRCGQDPENCDLAAASIPGSPADAATRPKVLSDIENHIRGIPGQGEYKWRFDDVRIDGASAFVTTCAFDTAIAFNIGDPSDPADDVVVNDVQASTIVEWEMRYIDGKWGLYDTQDLQRLEGGDLCDF